MAAMTAAQRDDFLRQSRIAMLTTIDLDGVPTSQPVWFDWDGAVARVFTSRGSAKIERISVNPRVCLAVAEPVGIPEAWVSIEGTAAVDAAGGWPLAQLLTPRYYAADQARKALADWGARPEQWVALVITPKRIRSLAAS